ncbi:MAG TPA: hypothetical protein VK846_16430 [Candidatus Limnocylindria bacterium]|nr:hypothetical protein [Candidatus Limnocylindria bacterium]
MDSNWASDHLQTIRTLMERSAVYRRALAPVMLSSGFIGIAAAIVPCFKLIQSNRGFAAFWMSVGFVTLVTAYVLVRRQALREQEPFWSPPTRRVTEALLPPLIAGCAAGLFLVVFDHFVQRATWLLAASWLALYGCALNAASFFTPRGIKLFGRAFVFAGIALLFAWPLVPGDQTRAAHYVMGAAFGVLHVAYGGYLYFTERRRRA